MHGAADVLASTERGKKKKLLFSLSLFRLSEPIAAGAAAAAAVTIHPSCITLGVSSDGERVVQ